MLAHVRALSLLAARLGVPSGGSTLGLPVNCRYPLASVARCWRRAVADPVIGSGLDQIV
jgi:hypothetical protein